MSTFRATAFICVYNEADILPWTLKHLIEQGIDVYVIDNWSTDGSVGIARDCHAIVERFPFEGPSGIYEWRRLLRRVEELASTSSADWCIHHDADEIRRSPHQGESMLSALARVDAAGYNAIDHRVLCFHPTDEGYQGDPERYFRCCSEDGVDNRLPHIKTWKNTGRVSLADSGGHWADFPERRVYPDKFLLKHYPIRSSAHGERKVLTERIPRFDPIERSMDWHVQYDEIARTRQWLRDPAGPLSLRAL
jgi:glycosyltransferase involved in cell wall biosynthesis